VTQDRLRSTALELRKRAEQCLAYEAPTAASAHELANSVLDFLRTLDALSSALDTPYRGGFTPPEVGDTTPAVTLERALEACQERLRSALAELDDLRARR